jgi:polyphosphate kinase
MESLNRELSWLDFNTRVLQEANDDENPILERLKFLGIFSNNRDEFFRVRIATLRRMQKLAPSNSDEHKRLTENLDKIMAQVLLQENEYNIIFRRVLLGLKKHNIHFLNERKLNKQQEDFAQTYFKNNIRPKLFPIILDYFNAGRVLSDQAIYLAVELTDSKKTKKTQHILIEVPHELPRFLKTETKGDRTNIMFIEDVIRHNLPAMFNALGYDQIEAFIIKFTRDAELNIDNDVSKSFLAIMEESVKKRSKGIPVRFVYDKNIPKDLLDKIINKLHITTKNYQLRGGGRYHNLKDLMSFPNLRQELLFNVLQPIDHPEISDKKSIFKQLLQKDIFFNFPYHSFGHIIDFLREASIDPKVRSIKMTFYRAARDSSAMNALINAARNGKSVTVFLEIQARFDEQANIQWTQRLQNEGVRVIATIPGMKIHAKMILIRRKEMGENRFYSNISTGNFNESTAKVYSDYSLLTANQEIGSDLYNFFELLESRYRPPKLKHLYISPFHIREFFEEKVNREIENKQKGLESWMILKFNSISDLDIVNLLYRASNRGVKTDLIIRGINILQCGIQGFSENLNAFSIVGRYLEHARLFVFANGGQPEFYISSADLMTRNLDHRFEIVCPILDKSIQKQLMDIIQLQMNDTLKYRSLNFGVLNQYTRRNINLPALNSQEATHQYFANLKLQKQ